MNPEEITKYIDSYLSVSNALGRKDNSLKRLLLDFRDYLIENEALSPVTAKSTFDWAISRSNKFGGSGITTRVNAARGFLTFLHSRIPETQLLGHNVTSTFRRSVPYIYSDEEIVEIMLWATRVRPRCGLKACAYETMIGLMASTGIRVNEALNLKVTDIVLSHHFPRIYIHETKFHKHRMVPVHESTARRLKRYRRLRKTFMCDGLSDYFFLNDSGGRIQYKSLLKWFNKTLSKLNIQAHSNTRKPTMQCFRHTFAVNRLTHWCEQGEAVQDLIPHLSVYLGHVNVEDSYWYLTATPALLVTASDAFSRSVGQE